MILTCLVLVTVSLWGIILVLKEIRKYIQFVGIDMGNYQMEIREWFKKFNKSQYNSRKRDENLLREIHWGANKEGSYFKSLEKLFCDHKIDTADIVKQCRGIFNVSGKCSNDATEIRSGLIHVSKCLKESERILKLFEAMTEKVKSDKGYSGKI